MTLVVAGTLSAATIWASMRSLKRCRALLKGGVGAADDDELEARLRDKEQALVFGLALRNVRAWGRAALFGGTGCAVWELTGGSAHYPLAGGSFLFGFIGWAGCGELQRRIGSLAGGRRLRKGRR